MANKIELPRDWEWDDKKLKPKSGTKSSNTWEFDGKKFMPLSGVFSHIA